MLKRFYAVTKSRSLYEVNCLVENSPVIKKLDSRGDNKSSVAIGQLLNNGSHVNVGTFGWLGLYFPSINRATGKPYSADMTNTRNFGGHTSQVVGLFLNREPAKRCLHSGDTRYLSDTWINYTRATLEKIGWEHPRFMIGMDFAHLLLKK
jgi:hypothetical protein